MQKCLKYGYGNMALPRRSKAFSVGSQGEEESGVRHEGAGETSHARLESTLPLFSSLRHYLSAVTPRSLIAFFMQMKFTITTDIRTTLVIVF